MLLILEADSCLWAGSFNTLGLSLLLCNMGLVPTSEQLWRLNEMVDVKPWAQGLEYIKCSLNTLMLTLQFVLINSSVILWWCLPAFTCLRTVWGRPLFCCWKNKSYNQGYWEVGFESWPWLLSVLFPLGFSWNPGVRNHILTSGKTVGLLGQ